MIKLLVLLCLVVAASALLASEKESIEKGIEIGKEIATAVADGEFKKATINLAKKIAPFLGVLGPFLGIALSFIPTGPSLESKLMKKFDEVDRRFDRVDAQLDEVKKLINWQSIQVKLNEEEKAIRALTTTYREVLNAPVNHKEDHKRDFIKQYESDWQGAGNKLFDAVIKDDRIFSKNLFQAAVKFTDKDRKKCQQFMLGVVGLMWKGMVVQMAYYKWGGYKHLDSKKTKWTNRMTELSKEMDKIDGEVAGDYKDQSGKDLDTFSAKNSALSISNYASQLYSFLTTKYFWRYWMVVVFKDITGGDKHWHMWCGGHHRFRQRGKNIVVASVDKNWSRYQDARANTMFFAVGNRANKERIRSLDAHWMWKALNYNACNPYVYAGFIRKDANPVYVAPSHHWKKHYYNWGRTATYGFMFG